MKIKKTECTRFISGLGLILLMFLLPACTSLNNPFQTLTEDPLKSNGRMTTSGAYQLFNEESFEKVNLPQLLDPDGRHERAAPTNAEGQDQEKDAGAELEKAFNAFYGYADKNQRRNRVQDRLLAASEQRCNLYKNYLKRVESFQTASFGILTTVLAGAGAIATGGVNTRALAGLAGISSGVGAELRQDFFANVATNVVVPGIELRRKEIMIEINNRRGESLQVYTVEAAVRDVARYHGACSMNIGIEAAGVAVKTVDNPGPNQIKAVLADMRLNNSLIADINKPITEAQALKQKQALQAVASSSGSYPLVSPTMTYIDEGTPLQQWFYLYGVLDETFGSLETEVRTQQKFNEEASKKSDATTEQIKTATDANKAFEELLTKKTLSTQRSNGLKKLTDKTGDFGASDGEVSAIWAKMALAKDAERAILQGQLTEAMNAFNLKTVLPTKIYIDKITSKIAIAKIKIKENKVQDEADKDDPTKSLAGLLTAIDGLITSGI